MTLETTTESKPLGHKDLGLSKPKARRSVSDPTKQPFSGAYSHRGQGYIVDPQQMTDNSRIVSMDPEDRRREALRRQLEEPLNLPQPDPEMWDSLNVRLGYLRVQVLPELIGCRWDAMAKAVAMSCRPTVIRVLDPGLEPSVDSVWWRLTIWVDDTGKIKKCEQECKVPLTAAVPNGAMLRQYLKTTK